MSAPMDTLSHLLGNSLSWLQSQPEIQQLGKGVGLAYDMAVNAPMNTAYNVPMFDYEEDKHSGGYSSGSG